jgi:hypothetical protein
MMLPASLLQWLQEGRILAGQLETSTPGHTAWIGIYPLRLDRPGSHEVLAREGIAVLPGANIRVYRIRLFDISDSLRESHFSQRDMTNKRSIVVFGEEALFAKLFEIGVPLDILDSPMRVDYPL